MPGLSTSSGISSRREPNACPLGRRENRAHWKTLRIISFLRLIRTNRFGQPVSRTALGLLGRSEEIRFCVGARMLVRAHIAVELGSPENHELSDKMKILPHPERCPSSLQKTNASFPSKLTVCNRLLRMILPNERARKHHDQPTG